MSEPTSADDAFPELRAALDGDHSLSYREEHIVRLRFGLDVTGQCHAYDEISVVFGVTRERIRALERAALTTLGLPNLRSPAPSRLPDNQWDTRTPIELPPHEAATTHRSRSRRRIKVRPAREDLARALNGDHGLDDKTVHVLRLRFGLDDDLPRTREEVADGLGRSYEYIRQREAKGLAALNLLHLAPLAPGKRKYSTYPDATPYFNVMRSAAGVTWWRTEENTWTDGQTTGTWHDIEATYGPFREGPRGVHGTVLLQKGIVEHDPIALATIAHRIEFHYDTLRLQRARQHALAAIRTIRAREPLSDPLLDILAKTLHVPIEEIRRALPTAGPHLWEVDHPYYGAEGTRGDETAFESFADLRACLDGHPDDGSTVIYRWDWKDFPVPREHDDLRNGRETESYLYVYGLFPRVQHLFVLSCPIRDDQEPEVREWLHGPRMLGALKALWAPVLDTVTVRTTTTCRKD